VSPVRKKILLVLGSFVILCIACCGGGYILHGPSSIVGKYQTPPSIGMPDWHTWDWEFEETDSGIVKLKEIEVKEAEGFPAIEKFKEVTVRFRYKYVRGFPEVHFDSFAPRFGVSSHYLEISDTTQEGGTEVPILLRTEPGQTKRLAVSEVGGDSWITSGALWWRLVRR
jgi:hypothetical protein